MQWKYSNQDATSLENIFCHAHHPTIPQAFKTAIFSQCSLFLIDGLIDSACCPKTIYFYFEMADV